MCELFHEVAVFPSVTRWTTGFTVCWSRSFQGFFKAIWGSETSFRLVVVVAPLLLPLETNIRVGYQVGSILVESSLGLLILALRSFAIVLFILGSFVLFLVNILGLVRLMGLPFLRTLMGLLWHRPTRQT